MSLENRIFNSLLGIAPLISSPHYIDENKPKNMIKRLDEIKQYDINELRLRQVNIENSILRAQLQELQKGYKVILEGKEDDKKSLFDYAKDLSSNIGSALNLSYNALDSFVNLSVDPLFNARAAVIQDIRQVLPFYEGSLRLLEAHQKKEIKLEDDQLKEVHRRLDATSTILDSAHQYLTALEKVPEGYKINEEDVKEFRRLLFTGKKEDLDKLASRILTRVISTPEHQSYLRNYGDNNRTELGDFLERREKAYEITREGQRLGENGSIFEAVKKYKEAIAIDPLFDVAWYNLGCDYARLNNIPTAVVIFQSFLLTPNSGNQRRKELEEKAERYIRNAQKFLIKK